MTPSRHRSIALAHRIRPRAGLLLALLALAAPGAAQGTLTTVNGRVNDLSVHSSGDLLFCTQGRDVGRITTAGVVTVVADSASGPFSKSLHGVVETPAGDIAVVDVGGDVHVLTGGVAPATTAYSDLYMIQSVTDLMVDASGNYVIVSDTPSTGFRGINWISPNGVRWAYYLVAHTPVAIAADPLDGDILMADESNGGVLRRIDTSDAAHGTSVLDNTTGFGLTEFARDGDMAVETDGSAWIIAGGSVWRHDRGLGTTSLMASGLAQLRGVAIAASSGGVASASGWSVYLAEGDNPTTIREIGNAGAPADVTVPSLGTVPNRGAQLLFFSGFNAYELAVDLDGNLLAGGDSFGSGQRVVRVDLPSLTQSTIATAGDGLSGRIEGIHAATDGSIYVLTEQGHIQRIEESPLSVTTVFSDPGNDITVGKDMIRGRDGGFYVADRASFGGGQLEYIDPQGVLSRISNTDESRAVAADPLTARLLATEWNDTGFHGTVGRVNVDTGATANLPGFSGMNYSNAAAWADGDLVMDVKGNIFTISEDDWSLYRYNVSSGKKVRIGSSYLNHPSGLAIARSTLPSASGWSLYVAEWNFLWEIPDVAAPISTRLDKDAPPIGRLVGALPGSAGRPRAMCIDSVNGNFLVSTSSAEVVVLNLTGLVSVIVDSSDGLSGDLIAIAPFGSNVLVANRAGTIFEVTPSLNVSVWYDNAMGTFSDVRGLEVDGNGGVLVLDRPPGLGVGRLYRIAGGRPQIVGYTNRGLRMAIDPLTADVFVTQQGNPADGGGEILRVDTFASPTTAGHYRGNEFRLFDFGPLDGALAFDDVGNFYFTTSTDGRIVRADRATGAYTTFAGNYMEPIALALAPGRVGTAGPLGTSLFVMDDTALWELGANELPAPPPPAVQPGLAPPAELRVEGFVDVDTTTKITLDVPVHANQAFAILPSFLGKVPGFPLHILGDPDSRVIPSNYNFLWLKLNGAIFPGCFAFLDGSGQSPAHTAFYLPNDPSLLGLDLFFDLAWIVYDMAEPNGVDQVGGTSQLYVGQ